MKFQINIQPTALKMLRGISDARVRQKLVERIDSLVDEPEKLGKPLLKDLSGYRSIRAVGQRYRIIYAVDASRSTVSIVALGIRKDGDKSDIYSLARKLIRLRLVD
ncbi:MAG: type II toxin-antitoxin system RelE/ParE family toxin [Chthoniobacteraceae bacterium]|nr:type II toxin-antitoxin system RelE/ParE family toxin [Chthoniobacteraceae bacterium]